MEISLKDGTDEPVVVLDTDWSERMGDECAICERETPTVTIESAHAYSKVEICPDCLVKALTPYLSHTESSAPPSRSGR